MIPHAFVTVYGGDFRFFTGIIFCPCLFLGSHWPWKGFVCLSAEVSLFQSSSRIQRKWSRRDLLNDLCVSFQGQDHSDHLQWLTLPVYHPCPFTFLGLCHGRFITISLQNSLWGSAAKEDPVNADGLGSFWPSLFHWVHSQGGFSLTLQKYWFDTGKSRKMNEMGH